MIKAGFTVSHIVGYNRNRVIGLEGQMPWHHSDDLKYFKRVTMGCPIIMGRKTYESIGRPLPGRLNIVVSRSEEFKTSMNTLDQVKVLQSIDEALSHCELLDTKEVFIIGGGQIYRDSLSKADKLYITHIDSDEQGDTFYPHWDKNVFKKIASEKNSSETLEWAVYERNT